MTVKVSTILVVVVKVKVNMVTVSKISVTVSGSAVTLVVAVAVVVVVLFPIKTVVVTVVDARTNEGSQTVLVHVYGVAAVVVVTPVTPAVSRGQPHTGATTRTAVQPRQSMLLNSVREAVWTVMVLSLARHGLERKPRMVVVQPPVAADPAEEEEHVEGEEEGVMVGAVEEDVG